MPDTVLDVLPRVLHLILTNISELIILYPYFTTKKDVAWINFVTRNG